MTIITITTICYQVGIPTLPTQRPGTRLHRPLPPARLHGSRRFHGGVLVESRNGVSGAGGTCGTTAVEGYMATSSSITTWIMLEWTNRSRWWWTRCGKNWEISHLDAFDGWTSEIIGWSTWSLMFRSEFAWNLQFHFSLLGKCHEPSLWRSSEQHLRTCDIWTTRNTWTNSNWKSHKWLDTCLWHFFKGDFLWILPMVKWKGFTTGNWGNLWLWFFPSRESKTKDIIELDTTYYTTCAVGVPNWSFLVSNKTGTPYTSKSYGESL